MLHDLAQFKSQRCTKKRNAVVARVTKKADWRFFFLLPRVWSNRWIWWHLVEKNNNNTRKHSSGFTYSQYSWQDCKKSLPLSCPQGGIIEQKSLVLFDVTFNLALCIWNNLPFLLQLGIHKNTFAVWTSFFFFFKPFFLKPGLGSLDLGSFPDQGPHHKAWTGSPKFQQLGLWWLSQGELWANNFQFQFICFCFPFGCSGQTSTLRSSPPGDHPFCRCLSWCSCVLASFILQKRSLLD